jgi:hypothetical protein
MGLEKEHPEGVAPERQLLAAAEALCRYHLEDLFRRGYHQAVQLKQQAEAWVQGSWFAGCGLPLTFWGETWLGVMGGLLIKRPLFFDSNQTGTLYREFASAADIEWTRGQLQQIQTLDRLLGRLNLERRALPTGRFITYQNLLLTLWARYQLGLTAEVRPLTTEAFRPFFQTLFGEAAADDRDHPRPIGTKPKEAFLQWLAVRSQAPAESIAETLGATLDGLFEELEDNYGRVAPDRINPRYMPHFLLAPSKPHPR